MANRKMSRVHGLAFAIAVLIAAAGTFAGAPRAADSDRSDQQYLAGKGVYDYYCYQCHGYAGDGATEAALYLSPAPRNFQVSDRRALSAERMAASVSHGRPGTAMTRFGGTLSVEEIDAVVYYIREAFMTATPVRGRYHTPANGWEWRGEHAAALFVRGDLAVDASSDALTDEQQGARRTFMAACVSCHRGHLSKRGEAFGLRAVSYPRGGFNHRGDAVNVVSAASVYRVHDRAPVAPTGGGTEADRGRRLYLDNCAFCHANDGSGRNWIGSFLDSRPRNLTGAGPACRLPGRELRTRIADGLEGTSMPAWKHVLDPAGIEDVARFVETTLCATRASAGPRTPDPGP